MKDTIEIILDEWIADVEQNHRLTINYGSGDFYWEHLRDLAEWMLKNKINKQTLLNKLRETSG